MGTSYRNFFDWVWATWQPFGPHDSCAEKHLERYTRSISASHDLERCTHNGIVPSGEAGCPTQVITCILSSVCLYFPFLSTRSPTGVLFWGLADLTRACSPPLTWCYLLSCSQVRKKVAQWRTGIFVAVLSTESTLGTYAFCGV